jgi:hypothetical protein
VDAILAELYAIAAQTATSKAAGEGSEPVCGGEGEKSGCLGEGGDPTFVAKWDVPEHTTLDGDTSTLRLTVSNALPIPWTVKGRARLELSGAWHDTEWFTATLEPSATTTLELDLGKPVSELGLGAVGGQSLLAKQAAPGVVYVSLDASTQLPAALLRPSPTGEPWSVEALAELEAKGELGESTPLQEYIPTPNLRVSTDGARLDVFSKAFWDCDPPNERNMYSAFRGALGVVDAAQGVRWDFKTGQFGLNTTPANEVPSCE